MSDIQTAHPGQPQRQVKRPCMDKGVVRSFGGFLKVAEIILDVLAFICIFSGEPNIVFKIATILGFWYSTIMLILLMFNLTERLSTIAWEKVEFIICCVVAITYIVGSSICIHFYNFDAFMYGFFATVSYAIDAGFLSLAYRNQTTAVTITGTATNTANIHSSYNIYYEPPGAVLSGSQL